MNKSFRILIQSVLIALIVILPWVLSVQAAQTNGLADTQADRLESKKDGDVVSITIGKEKQKATMKFWTKEKLKEAKEMPIPVQSQRDEVNEAEILKALEEESNQPFVEVSGAAPSQEAVAAAMQVYAEDWAATQEGANDALAVEDITGTSQVYTSYMLSLSAMQTMYPHRLVGRLSFTTPNGTSYCSGSSIAGNVMVTAAHCVYDTTNNQFYSNWVFTPAYRNGSAPYGTFPATVCRVLTTWVNLTGGYSIGTWARYDVAVCNMGLNSAGKTLNASVGSLGRTTNASYTLHMHNLGYPFRDYNDALLSSAGLYLRTCVAETALYTTDVRRMGCNLGGGISGGPWMTRYAPGVVSGFVGGVNSGIFIGQQNIYGARFSNDNIVLLCNAAGC